ncbi:class I SAM-dependent methyltransferase [Undibacterium crateris]|uniref:class I SAM-dependent methyltransferase n=1 Tax=Undibacterium crateris TaxID=2528175 RepID=UPI00138970CE|nr:class I SAM-dependent methyltransferase [Undibacterium crateris]NDI85840.1 methyltransferase domain-containing protein [Undibacterium crateris]
MDALEKHIIDLDAWLSLPAGQYIKDWEQAALSRLVVDIFGFHALQIGMPQIDALSASRMPHRWQSVGPHAPRVASPATRAIAVVHDFTELPFDSQCMDLVILPHVLEFAEEPHQILREVERILIPEGRLLITGFNRASSWGARQALGRLRDSYFLPKEGEFISPARLKDWLKLLSMEVGSLEYGCYALPLRSEKWLQRNAMLEKIGKRWCPFVGAVYMMQAVKRVRGMHLIGPAWKNKKRARVQAVPVANSKK